MHCSSSFGKSFLVFLLSLGTLILIFHVNNSLQLWKWPTTATISKEQRRFGGNNETEQIIQLNALASHGNVREVTITFPKSSNVSDDFNLSYTSSSSSMIAAFIPKTGSGPNGDSNYSATNASFTTQPNPEFKLSSSSEPSITYSAPSSTEQTENYVQSKFIVPTPQPSDIISSNATPHFDKNDNHYPSLIPPLCTREEIRQGEWVPKTMPKVPYIPHINRCRRSTEFYDSGKPWNTWEWQPFAAQAGNCTFSQWNASQFCSLTRHATVAIVGDSLSWEQYASLAQLLGQPVSNQLQLESYFYGKWVIHTVCQNQTRLVFLREDVLKRVALVLNTTLPNVLILNRGTHFTPDQELEADLQSFVVPHVQAWQESCRIAKRPCHLFVRTTVPGHPSCASFVRPAKSVREMELFITNQSNYQPFQRDYHWQDFQRQNLLSLRLYQQANLTFEVLDGYDINILRPDDHSKPNRDCVHSCFPGKMDVYNQLLVHFLQVRGGVAEDATAMDSWSTIDPSNVVS